MIAVLLVGAVVLFFLQDWKAMILPMIDVPVSLIGTFAVMAALGFSLNNLTLFGLVLAIGIVVDDAIMVLENIERLMGTGLDARAATIKAMDELTGPIVSITLVLSSVFLPSCFVPGLTGQFYRQFALTIAASVIISAINALTLTPSRAVSIFRTEEADAGRGGNSGSATRKKEALPWWIFGIVGGALTVWLAPRLLPGHSGLTAASAEGASFLDKWLYWGETFAPGLLVGLVVGWFLIGPVNLVLGSIFRAFNRVFDGITAAYGWTIAKMLRLSVIVMVAYVGLLGLTVWRVASCTHRLYPHPGPGLPARQRPTARLRLGATDRRDPRKDRPDRPRHPRRVPRHPRCGAHGRRLRGVLPDDHQRLEPGHDVRPLEAVRPADVARRVRRGDRRQTSATV